MLSRFLEFRSGPGIGPRLSLGGRKSHTDLIHKRRDCGSEAYSRRTGARFRS